MKKTKGRAVLIALVCVLSLLLVGLVGFVIYMEAGARQEPASDAATGTTQASATALPETQTTETSVDVSTEPTGILPEQEESMAPAEVLSDCPINTPWGTLYYPGEYREWLTVENRQTPVYTVCFAARVGEKEYPLFDLCFGGDQGDSIGIAVDAQGKPVQVKAQMHTLTIPAEMSGADAQILYGMQESVSYLAAQLEKPGEMSTEPQDIVIETPFCNLLLPGKWEKQVRLEIRETDGYAVCFLGTAGSRENIPLFDIILDGTGEEFLGTVLLEGDMEIAVFCNTYEIEPGPDWSREERDLAFSLMEIINDVLDGLKRLDNFVPAE